MTKSQQLESILNRSGINTRRVKVLGEYAHVDTFRKYERPLSDIMHTAGFKTLSVSDGRHMDSFDGFRMVFQVAA